VAVKIRLKRLGKIRAPYYRVVVADSRTKRDGRVIEEIGQYHPTEHPSVIKIDSARAQYWLGVGAQPTEQVAALLKLTGDWGRFKGDANAKSTVQVKDAKPTFTIEKKKPIVIRSKASVKDAEAATAADAAADQVRVDDADSSSTVEHETPAQVSNS
jgi:small subunit ribosomal protein S16